MQINSSSYVYFLRHIKNASNAICGNDLIFEAKHTETFTKVIIYLQNLNSIKMEF